MKKKAIRIKDGKDEKLKNIIMQDRYRPHNDYSKTFIDGKIIKYEVQETLKRLKDQLNQN